MLKLLRLLVAFGIVLLSILYYITSHVIFYLFIQRKKDICCEIILITGGGRGLGKQIALEFARHKPFHIILWGRTYKPLEETCEEIKSIGIPCTFMLCDVSKRENIYKCAKTVKDKIGDVSILVNNAAVVHGKPLLELDGGDISQTLQVNVLSHFWTLKAFLPSMIAKNQGHIVSINSVLGLMGMSGASDYVASKFCLTGLSEALMDELHVMMKNGIRTTSIHPYHIKNNMFKGVTTRMPYWLLAPLSEEYVAEQTVLAVLTNRCQVLMPKLMYIFAWFKTVCPVGINIVMSRLTGTDKSMQGFKGHYKLN